LTAIEHGDARAADELLPLVYQELRKLAAHRMKQEKPGQTLQATALVHHRQGDYDKAEPLLVEVVELSEDVLVEGHPDTVAAMNVLIKLYEAWGKPQKAEEWRSKLPRKKGTEE
jgi:predicted Zn-dependent protease